MCGSRAINTGDPDDWPLQTFETQYAYKLLYYNSGSQDSVITDWTNYAYSLQDLFSMISSLQEEIRSLNHTLQKLEDTTLLLDSKIDLAESRVTLPLILIVLSFVLLGACTFGFFSGWPLRHLESEDFELTPTVAHHPRLSTS